MDGSVLSAIARSIKAYDVWPLFPLFKALIQYQEATGDPRIIPALIHCCRKIDQVISREALYSWAKFRAADLLLHSTGSTGRPVSRLFLISRRKCSLKVTTGAYSSMISRSPKKQVPRKASRTTAST